jgi:hypothetical protein
VWLAWSRRESGKGFGGETSGKRSLRKYKRTWWDDIKMEITPWCRGLLEKLTVSQLVKKFPAFYGTRRFMPATCPYAEPAQSSPCPIPLQDPF